MPLLGRCDRNVKSARRLTAGVGPSSCCENPFSRPPPLTPPLKSPISNPKSQIHSKWGAMMVVLYPLSFSLYPFLFSRYSFRHGQAQDDSRPPTFQIRQAHHQGLHRLARRPRRRASRLQGHHRRAERRLRPRHVSVSIPHASASSMPRAGYSRRSPTEIYLI